MPHLYTLLIHICAQVLILPNFNDFPSDAITVEFWMNSIDTCRPGVPFSYAHGEYEKQDNSFLIFNYNSFGVSGGRSVQTRFEFKSGKCDTHAQLQGQLLFHSVLVVHG